MNMEGVCGWYLCLVLLTVLHTGTSLTCLNCDSIAHPRLCTHVTKCFTGEKCGMDTFISQDGEVQYKLGCVDTNTCSASSLNTLTHGYQYFSCHRCCDDHDLCNARGCNSTGFPVNRGPICFNCEVFPEGYPCHKITHCESHEVCYNDAHLEFQSDLLYSSGCRSKHHCASENVDPMVGIGKRSVSVCTDCCQGDLCNLQCRKSSTCSDDSTCKLLMNNYNVCNTPDIAKQFCQKSCGLCANSTMMSCVDTRLDCAYIGPTVNMCGTIQAAQNYGCLKYCGYCYGSTMAPGAMTAGYATTSATSKNNNNNNPGYTGSMNTGYTSISTTSKPTVTTTTVVSTTSAPLIHDGDLVLRGPDWHYGNQDGNGPGTVINAQLSLGWIEVYWQNTAGTQSYRYGDGGKYEVQKYVGPSSQAVTTTTTVQTTFVPPTLYVGDKVVRGPDWTWQNQDGNGTGTVITAPSGGWITVKWDKTGVENSYRYGLKGKYDVDLYARGATTLGPTKPTTATTYRPTTQRPTTPPTAVTTTTTQIPSTQRPTTPTTPTTTVTILTTTTAPTLYVGDKVVRGPDWTWQNQDGNGTGTVITAPSGGWITVKWDKTGVENSYRYGLKGKYDVNLYARGATTLGPTKPTTTTTYRPTTQRPTTPPTAVTTTTTQIPSTQRPTTPTTTVTILTTTTARALTVGDHVIRGPDWTWKDQDGNTTGVVIGVPAPGWVTVRWGNGFENSYRYGESGAYDVAPVNIGYTSGAPTGAPPSGTVSVGDVVIRGPDWKYGNQDSQGTGHVVEVDNQTNGLWVKVQWKNGYENYYRFGVDGKYDVIKTTTTATTTTAGTTSTLPPSTTTANLYDLKVGDRVVRGPDWQWADQDGGGMGSVTHVDATGWVTVRWDNNFENAYRNGVQNKHDLQKVVVTLATTTQVPLVTNPPPTAGSGLVSAIYIGARVQRGRDWRYGSQDGNGSGTVLALPPNVPSGWVQVEWDNGYVNNYRLGTENAYDIMFVPGSYNRPSSG